MIWPAVLFAFLVIVLYVAASRPDSFLVQRSIHIKAPAGAVFDLINDLRAWSAWSPWEKRDPGMKRSFSDSAAGTGAHYAWSGNREVGQGRMEIAESSPPSRIEIRLDFIKPFEAHNVAEFLLEPQPEGTLVTWSMRGPSPLIAKIMGLFFSMDKMVGKDFEAGLAALKNVAESG